MEDLRGILYNLNATADAFARHAIDFRQVSAINRLMQTCLETIQKMKQLEEEVSPRGDRPRRPLRRPRQRPGRIRSRTRPAARIISHSQLRP